MKAVVTVVVLVMLCSPALAAAPVLDTGAGAAPLSYTTATLNGNLSAGAATNDVYVYWGQDTNAWSGTNRLGWRATGAFWTPVVSLSPGTSYYYRCYASNSDGVGWSGTAAFTTRVQTLTFMGGSYDGYDQGLSQASIGYPQVNNGAGASNVTSTSAWLNGMLVSTGNAPAAVAVYWGAADGATNRGGWAHTNVFGYVEERAMLTTNVPVASNTTYYYRFYATNALGEGWAEASSVLLTLGTPVLDTGAGAAPLSYTTATLNGNLAAGGSADVKLYWGPDTNAWSSTNGFGTLDQGAFLTAVTGLIPGTAYFYRCYGTNSEGEGWSETAAFTARVQALSFMGGSYDGYDKRDERPPMQGYKGTVVTFY